MNNTVTTPVTDTAAAGARPEWDRAWQASGLRRRVVRFLGGLPTLLDTALPTDDGIYATPAHWHSALYGHLVLRKVGTTFTAPDCYRVLKAEGLAWDRDRVVEAIVGFLAHLKAAGHVTYEVGDTGRPAGPIRVTDTLTPAPAPIPTPTAPTARPEPVAPPSATADDADMTPPSTGLRTPTAPPAAPASAPVREPRSAAEATWLEETTNALGATGLAETSVQALLGIARWGTPVTIETPRG